MAEPLKAKSRPLFFPMCAPFTWVAGSRTRVMGCDLARQENRVRMISPPKLWARWFSSVIAVVLAIAASAAPCAAQPIPLAQFEITASAMDQFEHLVGVAEFNRVDHISMSVARSDGGFGDSQALVSVGTDVFSTDAVGIIASAEGSVSGRGTGAHGGAAHGNAYITYYVAVKPVTSPPPVQVVPLRIRAMGVVNTSAEITAPIGVADVRAFSSVQVNTDYVGFAACSTAQWEPPCHEEWDNTSIIHVPVDQAVTVLVTAESSAVVTHASNPAGEVFHTSIGEFLVFTDPRIEIDPDFAFRDHFTLVFSENLTAPVLVSAVLPSSRSVQVGVPATAFATIINAGSSTATGCGISPLTSIPATFAYQTTNPATNQVTGTPNTPVDILAGVAQSFVFAFTPTAPINSTDVQLSFDCTNSDPAAIYSGLNTLLFSASSTPVPDIVALAATLNSDGIVNIPGSTGTGVFAVATVNVGASATITASADTGGVSVPVSISMCETNPATGACISAIGSSVTTQINANATPTFGIFVTGSGNVPFDPAANRISVRFKDSGGVTRGATSVAVRTQ